MSRKTSALCRRRVTSAYCYAWLTERLAELLSHLGDSDKRGLQVAFDVDRQGLDRGDVENAAALVTGRFWSKHQPIDAGEKGGQGLPRSCWGKNQSRVAADDCRPAK